VTQHNGLNTQQMAVHSVVLPSKLGTGSGNIRTKQYPRQPALHLRKPIRTLCTDNKYTFQ